MKEATVNVDCLALNGNEVIVRQGTAAKLFEPRAINPSTRMSIKAPGDWVEKHAPVFAQQPYVLFDFDARTIHYHDNPVWETGTVISGAIDLDPAIEKLEINTGKKFDCDSLALHLRRYARYASNAAILMDVVAKLKRAKINLTATIEKWKEKDGSQKVDFNQTVTNDLIREFSVSVPLFKGEAAREVRVEIVIESVTNGQVVLFMESLDVEQLLEEGVKEIFARERTRFEAKPDVVILER